MSKNEELVQTFYQDFTRTVVDKSFYNQFKNGYVFFHNFTDINISINPSEQSYRSCAFFSDKNNLEEFTKLIFNKNTQLKPIFIDEHTDILSIVQDHSNFLSANRAYLAISTEACLAIKEYLIFNKNLNLTPLEFLKTDILLNLPSIIANPHQEFKEASFENFSIKDKNNYLLIVRNILSNFASNKLHSTYQKFNEAATWMNIPVTYRNSLYSNKIIRSSASPELIGDFNKMESILLNKFINSLNNSDVVEHYSLTKKKKEDIFAKFIERAPFSFFEDISYLVKMVFENVMSQTLIKSKKKELIISLLLKDYSKTFDFDTKINAIFEANKTHKILTQDDITLYFANSIKYSLKIEDFLYAKNIFSKLTDEEQDDLLKFSEINSDHILNKFITQNKTADDTNVLLNNNNIFPFNIDERHFYVNVRPYELSKVLPVDKKYDYDSIILNILNSFTEFMNGKSHCFTLGKDNKTLIMCNFSVSKEEDFIDEKFVLNTLIHTIKLLEGQSFDNQGIKVFMANCVREKILEKRFEKQKSENPEHKEHIQRRKI